MSYWHTIESVISITTKINIKILKFDLRYRVPKYNSQVTDKITLTHLHISGFVYDMIHIHPHVIVAGW